MAKSDQPKVATRAPTEPNKMQKSAPRPARGAVKPDAVTLIRLDNYCLAYSFTGTRGPGIHTVYLKGSAAWAKPLNIYIRHRASGT